MGNEIFKIYVIGLDKSSDRFKAFLVNNSHLQAEFFQGVKGTLISEEEKISMGLLSKENHIQITSGEAGCALSHRNIWEITKKNKIGSLILEDDVITHPGIVDFININYEEMMKFDITHFSVNNNTILESISPEGIHSLRLFANQYRSPQFIKQTLKRANLNEVRIDKLITSFGSSAYFLSPKGADLLIKKIFPFKGTPIKLPLKKHDFIPTGIDSEAIRYYKDIKAIVCNPLIAYSPNIDSSTIKKSFEF